MGRAEKVMPISLAPLLVLVLLATAWLIFGGRDEAEDRDAAGPLFLCCAEDVLELTWQRGDVRGRLSRAGDDWQLSGTLVDLVDSAALAGILRALCAERASAVLGDPAALRDDYGLAAPAAPQTLTLKTREGSACTVALGKTNPATGLIYAAGAGRKGVFAVTARVGHLLSSLPAAVRLRRLWPVFDPADVDTLRLNTAGLSAADVLARDSRGAWWLRGPPDATRRIGTIARRYAEYYDDRNRRDEHGLWWRADTRAVGNLFFQLGECVVKDFAADAPESNALRRFGLTPPSAEVRLSSADGGLARAVAIGAEVAAVQFFAQRDRRLPVLVLEGKAREILLQPLAAFLCTSVLDDALARADSLRLRRRGDGVIQAIRGPGQWLVQVPDSTAESRQRGEELIGDLILNLSRLEILEPLPPAGGVSPLTASTITELTIWQADPASAASLQLQFGRLAATDSTAVYFPGDGKLLRIPEWPLSTLHNLFRVLVAARR